jgi:hypothetical protein
VRSVPESLHVRPNRSRGSSPLPPNALLSRTLSFLSRIRSGVDVDTLVTLGLFSGIGLLASLVLLLLDHQLNGQLPSL